MKRINVVIRAGQIVLLLLSAFTFIIVAATEQGQTTSGVITNEASRNTTKINEGSTSDTTTVLLTNVSVEARNVTESKAVKIDVTPKVDELNSEETIKINAAKLGKVMGKAIGVEQRQSIPVEEVKLRRYEFLV